MNEAVVTTLSLLIFTVGNVVFAMDTEQAQHTAPYTGEQAEDLFYFHKEFGFGDADVVYQTPVIVTIRTHDTRSYRIVIDAMEDIVEVSLNNLRRFPSLVEPFSLKNGMWGLLVRNGQTVILVDFERLFTAKMAKDKLTNI